MDVQEKIKRPKNAYLLFSNDRRPAMKKLYPNATNLEIFEKIGQEWNQLPPVDKEKYFKQAKFIKIEHQQKYPGYVYTPRRRMTFSSYIDVTTSSPKTIEEMRQEALTEYENLKKEYQYLGALKVKQKIKIYETALKHQEAVAEYKAMTQAYEHLAKYQNQPKTSNKLEKQVKDGKIHVFSLSGTNIQTQLSDQSNSLNSSSNCCHGDLSPCQFLKTCKETGDHGNKKQTLMLKKQTITRRDLLQNYQDKIKQQKLKQLQGPSMVKQNIETVKDTSMTDDDRCPVEGGLSKMAKRIQSNLPICTSVSNSMTSNIQNTNTPADYNIVSDGCQKYSISITKSLASNKTIAPNYNMVSSGLDEITSVPVNNITVSHRSGHNTFSTSLTSTNQYNRIIRQKSPVNCTLLSTCGNNRDIKPLTQAVIPGGLQNNLPSDDSPPYVLVPVAYNTHLLYGLPSICNISSKQTDPRRRDTEIVRDIEVMTNKWPTRDPEIVRDVDVMTNKLPTRNRKRKHTVLKDETSWLPGEPNISNGTSTDSNHGTSELIPTETMKLPIIVVDYPTNH